MRCRGAIKNVYKMSKFGEVTVRQVGAASRALSGEPLLCASLKSNMGHLEAAAAAAGLSSLVAGPLLAGVVAVNA